MPIIAPPPPRVIYFDGCCEPRNPGGWMGWAWVALAADGSELAHYADVRPQHPANTNNVAEYLGLIGALTWLCANRYRYVLVRGDSQLVIRQMTGAYRVNSPALRAHYEDAAILAHSCGARFEWVRREINHRADDYSRSQLPPMWRRP